MPKMTRRDFLRLVAAGMGTAAASSIISACSGDNSAPASQPPAPSPTTKSLPADTRLPTEVSPATEAVPDPTDTAAPVEATPTIAEPSATPKSAPELVVARGGEPEDLVRRALEALGGMGKFVKSGDDVIIKPNICVAYHTYEYAATTNPWVVAALVKLCLEAGAGKVRVMDKGFGGTVQEAYIKSGIREQVEAAGGEMAFMPAFKYKDIDIPEGKDLKKAFINDDILKANVLINVPIAKTHDLAKLTLGMKNLMGVILDRPAIHINVGQRLADITSRIRPALTIVDAVRILTANGPTGGNLDDVKKLDTVIASPDIVAADSYAATLFNMQPTDLSYIVKGAEMGLGKSDLSQVRMEEINVGG